MRRHIRGGVVVAVLCAGCGARAVAEELRPETSKAWSSYVEVTERRIARELASRDRFLVLDFGATAAADRTALKAGRFVTRKVDTVDAHGQEVDVPSGMVHHWTGAVLVPGASLDSFLVKLRSTPPEVFERDVIRSSILERGAETTRTFLKVQRTKVVTVVYNTEHVVAYRHESATRASSTSHATKIAELDNPNTPQEREKAPGEDHGFMWGWNSYWRYEQVQGGVIVECESVSLSRSIPSLIRYLVTPIIDGIARESLEETLGAIRTQFGVH